MKIAIIHPDFSVKGGAENLIMWVCEDLAVKYSNSLTVFSVDFGDFENRLKSIHGVKIQNIPIPRIVRNNKVFRMFIAPIYLKSNLLEFDIVNVFNYPASLWVGIANLLSWKKLPAIIWYCFEPARFLYNEICNTHTPEYLQVLQSELNTELQIRFLSRAKLIVKSIYKPFLRYLDKVSVRTFSKVLTLSDFVGRQVREIYGLINVYTCPPGIKEMQPVDKINNKDVDIYFLTVSRLESNKNIQSIIEAFAALKNKHILENIKYYIIGNGPFKEHLQRLCSDKGLSNIVEFPGYIKREELNRYYSGCLSIIYLPYDEPYGLPYLEAAAYSKPSISSNHGGPSELVVNSKTGLLVDPSNIEEIAGAIKRIVDNKGNAEKMGRKAKLRLEENYSWETYIEKYSSLLS